MTSGQGRMRRARGGSHTGKHLGPRRQPHRPAPRRQPHRPAPRRQPHRPAGPSRCRAVVLALAVALTVVGCGQAGQGAPVAPRAMTVSSEAFGLSQNILPQRYTCHGAGINPPLDWSGAPADTKSLALIVDDSSAPINPFIYWLVFDIQPGTTDIQQGALAIGARQALNSAHTAAYDPPCPSGHPHSYRFTIYALNRTLNFPNGAPLLEVWTAIADATIGRGRTVPTGYP